MAAAALRSPQGRFSARTNLPELLVAVPAICRHVSPDSPSAVSRRAFDRARDAAGWPQVPTAAQVLRRLNSACWPELLEVLLDSRGCSDRTFGQRGGRQHAGGYSDAEIALALNDAARACGLRTLSARQYDEVRGRMLDRARRRQGLIATRMPTVAQIQGAAGNWDQACRRAGLSSGPAHPQIAGTPVVDALDLVASIHRVLPSQKQLERFMRANRLALARRARPWAADLAAVRSRRSARGLDTPADPPGAGWRQEFERPVSGLAGPSAKRKRATVEECEEAVAAWLASLASDDRPTQRSYARWQAANPDRPAASVLGRHGGLRELMQRAGAGG